MQVLFVCLGNICRSPTAEGVFRALVRQQAPELDIEIESAGTTDYHSGEPPDRRAQAAARQRGIELGDLRARIVEDRDFEYFDRLASLSERFLECAEFVHNLDGTRVTWEGYVKGVSGRPDRDQVFLRLTPEVDSMRTAFVRFPDEFRTKLFSLRKGDRVVIVGVLKLSTPNMPDVEGESIELLA